MSTRVLIIEDDQDVVDLLRLAFSNAGDFDISSVADGAKGLREAQENPYLLLTYKEKDESKMLVNPHKEAPTKVFGPGWNTNIDALRNNPFAPGPTPTYIDLKTLGHAVSKLL